MPTTVFWPTDVCNSGFCYGWIKPAICVAGVLQKDSKQEALEALQLLFNSPQWLTFAQTCEGKLVILGNCTFTQEKGRRKHPVPLLDLTFPGHDSNYTLVYYHRHSPSSMRFYSLDILRLDWESETTDRSKRSVHPTSIPHDFTVIRKSENLSGLNSTVIRHFNAAKAVEAMIQKRYKPVQWKLLPPAPSQYSLNVFATCGTGISKCTSFVSHALSTVCNTPIFLVSPSPLLKDISATIQQIDVRAEQADFLAHQVPSFKLRNTVPIAHFSAQYVKYAYLISPIILLRLIAVILGSFYNTVWLILNDITIGAAFGSFLCENHVVLSHLLNHAVESVLINWVQWALGWLNSWPAGLKLNTELSRFYFNAFTDLVAIWGRVLRQAAPHLPFVIYGIGTISCGGVTLAISLLSDLLALLTAHVYVCYFISATVYQQSLRTAGSLWNLFRGKRYNVLRNRIDSWEYDIDQLLFGTILFTLWAFLFPTILAYYALFAMMRLLTIFLHASMETLLALMNHFPLFALMLRAKDPWRLPGGVFFLVTYTPQSKYPMLVAQNQPVPFSSIFFQYIGLWSRLSSHYNPLRLLRCVFSGEYLTAIPRYSIRYNKIPKTGKEGPEKDAATSRLS